MMGAYKEPSKNVLDHVPTTLIEFERILHDVVRTAWFSPECEGGLSG